MPVSKDHYYRLASNLPQERIQAASCLLTELTAANSESDFKYALQRLITGLASSHDSARIGFSMCLTELISLLESNEHFTYTAEKFLYDLEFYLNKQIKDKQKGKNLRAYLFGKIFGIQSLINSTLVQADNEQLITSIIDSLFEISLTKSWIREIAIVTIVKLINKFQLATNENIIPYIFTKLSENNLLRSMDGLLTYLSIPCSARDHLSSLATLKVNWKNNDPLTKGNLPFLKDAFLDKVVLEKSEEDKKEKNSLQKGSWNAQLHYVWAPLLSELCVNELKNNNEEHKSKKQKTKKASKAETPVLSLSTFWPTFDSTFFSNSASSERKHTGLQIMELCFKLPDFKAAFFAILFDENLTRCLINHVSKKDRVLNNLTHKVLANAVETAKRVPHGRVELIKALEFKCILFDRVTKTKTIKDVMSLVSSASGDIEADIDEWKIIVDWVLHCEKALLGKVHKNDADSTKQDIQTFIFDALLSLVRGNKNLIRASVAPGNEAFALVLADSIRKILEYFANIAYVGSSESDVKEIEIKLANDRLHSVLADVMECTKGSIDWSGIIVKFLAESEKSNGLRTSIDSNDDLMKTKEQAFDVWSKLGESIKSGKLKDGKLRMSKCLVMLCSTALMELYGGDSESFGVIDDLINIYNDFQDKSNGFENILDTLVDLLLTYLTQKSGLKKRIGTSIWEAIIYDIDGMQLERLFEVLMTRENKEGIEQLFNQVIDDYIEDDEEDGEEEGGNAKILDQNRDEDNSSSESDDSDDSDDSDEEDEEEEEDDQQDDQKAKIEEVEKSTTSALAKALHVNEAEINGKNDDDDDDDDDGYESNESMSDEQMMAIDTQLSAIFQQRQESLHEVRKSSTNGNERKLEAKDARELMALCKLRILDLLDFYVTIHPDNKECASIIVVLIDVMELTVDVKVGEKAHKLVKKISKNTFKFERIEDELEGTFSLIDTVLTRASTAKFGALSKACSQAAIYLVRSIVNSDSTKFEDYIRQVIDVYSKHLVKWAVNPNDKSGSSIFNELINWINSKRTVNKS